MNTKLALKAFAALVLLSALHLQSSALLAQTGPGPALSFDGEDDRVVTPLVMDFSQGATLEVWIKTTADRGMILAGRGGSTAYRGMGLFLEPVELGGLPLLMSTCGVSGSHNFAIFGPSVNDGQWHHLAGTWDGTTNAGSARLYVDGILQGTATAVTNFGYALTNYCLGSRPVDYYAFGGLMDEARIWNVARSQPEIQANMYNTGLSGSTPVFAVGRYWVTNIMNDPARFDRLRSL